MKITSQKWNKPLLFVLFSSLWVIISGLLFSGLMMMNGLINDVENSKKDLDNLNYYIRSVDSLQAEYDSISSQSFTSKSTAEFLAKLPKISEFSGIKKITIENTGIKKDSKLEVTELKISVLARFQNLASFIDILERSKLPIQISSLSIGARDDQLSAVLIIQVYKKVLQG